MYPSMHKFFISFLFGKFNKSDAFEFTAEAIKAAPSRRDGVLRRLSERSACCGDYDACLRPVPWR